MASLDRHSMTEYLSRSIASINQNKLNGLLAEVSFRRHVSGLGFAGRVSPGGWIARRVGPGDFGHDTVVLFPECICPGTDYSPERALPTPDAGLHTICATFHQSGISAFYCSAVVEHENDTKSVKWRAKQLGLPEDRPYQDFPGCLVGRFPFRARHYNFLRYNTAATSIPPDAIPEEFSKEHLRISFQTRLMCQISDVDGIFWGEQFTYPVEIKEKTASFNTHLGAFFGLDVGPFVKLAFYAAKRGNLHSLFVVREIDSPETRNLVGWWLITYENLAKFASWVQQGGGRNMQGGQSSVVCIPKSEFLEITRATLSTL